jgi:predicted enzyme related to lactoylglutathione lyase
MKLQLMRVYVNDQEKALKFYTDILGFAKKADFSMGKYRWLTVVSAEDPEGTQLLLEPDEDAAAKAFQQAMFAQSKGAAILFVGDIQAEYARLKELGVTFTMQPTKSPGSTFAILNDTCGNLIQLVQIG